MTLGEQRLLSGAPSGQRVDISELPEEERVISAELIRRLCVGLEAKTVDARGVQIRGARILDTLELSFCTIPHPLTFEGTTFERSPVLDGSRAPSVQFVDCVLPGFSAAGVSVDYVLSLESSEVHGEVKLLRAKVEGNLDCARATFINHNGVALSLDRAEIGGNVLLCNGFRSVGQVALFGAKVEGQLNCSGAELVNERGIALLLDGAEIGRGVLFCELFSAMGAVQLFGAKIEGQFACVGAKLMNERGNALALDRAEICGSMLLSEFSATGEVRLLGAKIEGVLAFSNATLVNECGDALSLDRAEIGGDVFLQPEFTARGGVRLLGAKIGGQLDCSGARLDNERGFAFRARDADIGHALIFKDVAVTGGVDLYRASTRSLIDDVGNEANPLGSWNGAHPLVLEGFNYARFGDRCEWDSKLRRRWLKQTSEFQQGAWQHLADVYRAHGRDDEATRVAIAMHNDRLARAPLSRPRKAGRWVLRLTVGHGYRPWLAGVWAFGFIVAFAVLITLSSGSFIPEKEGVTGSPQPFIYASDAFLPIVDFGEADRWMPTDWVRWCEWAVIALGWTLSTMFVAGFTRIVRS